MKVKSGSFGNLLRKYRERATDPYAKTRRKLSQARMADLIREETKIAISPQQISAWELEKESFPPQGARSALDGIVKVLQRTGGIQTLDEINEFILAAGYQPPELNGSAEPSGSGPVYPRLTNQGMIHAFYEAAGSDDYWDWITRAGLVAMAVPSENRTRPYLGPAVPDMENLIDEEWIALDAALSQFVDRGGSPPPAVPEAEVEYTRRDTNIRVAKVAKAWLLQVDTLALIAAGTLDQMGGAFYSSLLADLEKREDKTDVELNQFLHDENVFPGDLRNDNPAYRSLPEDLGARVLPYAEEGRAGVFIITRKASKDDSVENFEESLRTLVENLVRVADENNVRSIALPLVGSGSGGQMPPETVSRIILETLISITNFGSVKSITLVTIADDVVLAAQRKIDLLNFNRAQEMLNDEPVGGDLLGIEEEVHAMAESLVLRDVNPPLAVGILGGWGTGKSFVMHLMQQKVTTIRTRKIFKGWPEGKDDPDANIFAGHIYQIRFNAWTYAKSNLWASLMQTIFFELNHQLSLEQKLVLEKPSLDGGQIYQLLYEPQMRTVEQNDRLGVETDQNALWETMRALKQKKLDALRDKEEQVENQKEQRDKVRADRILRLKLKKQAGEQAVILAETVLKASGEISDEQMEKLKRDLKVSTTYYRLRKIYWESRWKFAGLILLGLVLLVGSILISRVLDLSGIYQWLSPLVVTLSGLLMRVMPDVLRWAGQVNQMIDSYENVTEDELDEWETIWRKELAKERLGEEREKERDDVEKIDQSAQSMEDKLKKLKVLADKGNLAAIDRRLAYLQGQADEQRRLLGPTADYVSLVDFVQARLDEKYYENKLGLMHQVKQDIDELTDGLVIQDWDAPDVKDKKKALFPRGKARVVLYIDDLDRCQPKRVVEVMEAVQLLLNTRLFVVVLGLDTRYVTRALEKEYKEILQREGDPSGLDYIEKIIQIPYRVRPIEKDGLKNYLDQQMDVQLTEPGDVSSGSGQLAAGADLVNLSESGDDEGQPDPVKIEDNVVDSSQEIIQQIPERDLTLEVIRFQPSDKRDLEACCNQIQLTPRSVKRLVNVFKLVKIFWFRKYGGDKPRLVKQTMLGLLALSAGYPEVMREIFAEFELRYRDPLEVKKTVSYFLEEYLQQIKSPNQWQVDRFEKDFRALRDIASDDENESFEFFEITMEKFEQVTFNLVRSFSFVGDPTFAINPSGDNPPPAGPGGMPSAVGPVSKGTDYAYPPAGRSE